jgi:hypothetical protein
VYNSWSCGSYSTSTNPGPQAVHELLLVTPKVIITPDVIKILTSQEASARVPIEIPTH